MDFTDALAWMEQGKKLLRRSWEDSGRYYYFDDDGFLCSSQYGRTMLNIKETEADDWEFFEEPEKTLSDKVDNAIVFGDVTKVCTVEDIKEFIKQIKKKITKSSHFDGEFTICETEIVSEIIDELAGERFE